MFKFGILEQEEFLRTPHPRLWGPRVAYNLLAIGDTPTPQQVKLFEDISFSLQTSNGTFRTSFANRFAAVNERALVWMRQLFPAETRLRIEDRAVSHGLTAQEWAVELLGAFPALEMYEASDVMLDLFEITVPGGEVFIVEADGTPIQYIRPPFVVPVHQLDATRYPVNQLVGLWGRRRWRQQVHLPEGWQDNPPGSPYRVRRIPFIHPHAQQLLRQEPRFQFRRRSVFERSDAPCHVMRTMNILNRGYFSEQQLREAIAAIRDSLHPDGLWIIGRTLEEDFSHHVSLLRRGPRGWEKLERIGQGSEIEDLILSGS